jgi:acetate kinase
MNKNLVLVLNCGSSSIKFAALAPDGEEVALTGLIQRIGSPEANIKYTLAEQTAIRDIANLNYHGAIELITEIIHTSDSLKDRLLAVGHRVVHGGEKFTSSVLIDDQVLRAIRACAILAPLHNPANIIGIEEARKAFPELKQAAVFDTAFHQTMPQYAYIYPIPYELYLEHRIRRYGFHGTSHHFVGKVAALRLAKDFNSCALITAHLGNGCSVTAILDGKSVDTSMGLTPLEGLVMGTRSGDIDPGLPQYLSENLSYDMPAIINMLNRESGMLGISGVDSDLRPIESKAAEGDQRCNLALDVFCYRLAKQIAGYLIPLGRIDALVFTGGIGENSRVIRSKTLYWLRTIGFSIDQERNQNNGSTSRGIITADTSNVMAMVIPTNEELMIAQDTVPLI